VFIEYCKAAPDDLLIRVSAINRGPVAATLHLLPTLWFKNDWSWHPENARPRIQVSRSDVKGTVLRTSHREMPSYCLYCEPAQALLFTENETNTERLFGEPNATPFVKDGFDACVVHGQVDAVNPEPVGSKAAAHYIRTIGPAESAIVKLRLCTAAGLDQPLSREFDTTFELRRQEADAFYERVTPFELPEDMRNVQRQAFAGMLWNKQYYRYRVSHWLNGDPGSPPPPEKRKRGRNHEWWHVAAGEVLSMPDKWEYPWFAAWDMAFHCVTFALIDPDFAKDQLLLLTREWYMHPNGQIPAYEWDFSDVNPPVHAWAAIRVYQIEQKMYGRRDRAFLERVFQKLLLNFTWWVNRKDSVGNNIFEGGFLGLDNIGPFDRNTGLPGGGRLEQADGTSWMAMYCLNLLAISLELAREDAIYQDLATKFYEHFVYIGSAVNSMGQVETGLWNEREGYYFDLLQLPDGRSFSMSVQTIAGLIPTFALALGDRDSFQMFPDFAKRARWFAKYQPDLLRNLADMAHRGVEDRIRLALVDSHKLERILAQALDEDGLLSPYGVRSLSKRHAAKPFVLELDGQRFVVDYEPGESTTSLFGGNSNWRGPVWFPLNFLLIETLQKHHYFLGDEFKVTMPSGSGKVATLWDVATELSRRLIMLFVKGADGRRPIHGRREKFQSDPHWRDLIVLYEYFHGETGEGLGASHQTGWTGIVAKLIQQYGEYTLQGKPPQLIEDEELTILRRQN